MTIKHLFSLLFLSIIVFEVNAKAVYVSASEGNDANSGLSEQNALRTIRKAKTIVVDTLFLKAGDQFYEPLGAMQNIVVTRYGKGANPVVCGLRKIVVPKWNIVGANIWQIDLSESNYIGAGDPGSSLQNNIGCIYEYDKDQVHGRKVQYRDELLQDWDIWQTEHFDKGVPISEFDNLYLYLHKDPNTLQLGFSIYNTAVSMKDATLDGVDIVGFGFGISAKSNSYIRNCRLDIIGGRTQIGYVNYVCYGNGIEFYVSENIENCLVENCIISRCYDCGVTIQGSDRGKATPSNITIRNNLIKQCCQGWEDFLRNDPEVVYENCVFENNVVVNSGENGFGYPASRFKYCHILGNNYKGNKGMIIRNNIFAGGNYYCSGSYEGKYTSNIWSNNVCYIQRGEFLLSNYYGSNDVIMVPKEKGTYKTLKQSTNDAIRKYRALTGDETTEFDICSKKSIKRKTRKFENKYSKE